MRDFGLMYRKLTKTRYVYIASSEVGGLGIFAARHFHEAQVIVEDSDGDYYDEAVSEAQALGMGLDLSVHCFQIGDDAYLLPHGSIDDLINHRCEPSAGIRLTAVGYQLIALRPIAPGEELTYDYSTYISNPREYLRCRCGAACCRRDIGPFRDLPPELRAFYLARGVVGAFAAADAAAAAAGRPTTRPLITPRVA
jgi:hypothetical protein